MYLADDEVSGWLGRIHQLFSLYKRMGERQSPGEGTGHVGDDDIAEGVELRVGDVASDRVDELVVHPSRPLIWIAQPLTHRVDEWAEVGLDQVGVLGAQLQQPFHCLCWGDTSSWVTPKGADYERGNDAL